MECYFGLLNRINATDSGDLYAEPTRQSGYSRVKAGTFEEAVEKLSSGVPIIFNDSMGYGPISHYAIFDSADGRGVLSVVRLEKTVDVENGTIPILRNGRLSLGVSFAVDAAASPKTSICI